MCRSSARSSWHASESDGIAKRLLKAGHGAAVRDVMMAVHFLAGESVDHAREFPRQALKNYLTQADEANQVAADPTQYRVYQGLGKIFELLKTKKTNYELMYPNQVIFGDTEQCLNRIADYEAMGATHVSLITNFGGIPHAEIMRSLNDLPKA
jgi:alkanesulfonate monooxygenase SsuD/methylene tetrahydromethanopterin reductase-like flavin-dependent oxidoreductase (luciferase family)